MLQLSLSHLQQSNPYSELPKAEINSPKADPGALGELARNSDRRKLYKPHTSFLEAQDWCGRVWRSEFANFCEEAVPWSTISSWSPLSLSNTHWQPSHTPGNSQNYPRAGNSMAADGCWQSISPTLNTRPQLLPQIYVLIIYTQIYVAIQTGNKSCYFLSTFYY